MSISSDLIVPVFDEDQVQAVVVRAALAGDETCLRQLPGLSGAFDEPYRSMAAEILRLREAGRFVDENVLGATLGPYRLTRIDANGQQQLITAGQAVNLLRTVQVQPGQAETYLELMADRQRQRRQEELKANTLAAAQQYAGHPEALLGEIERLVAVHRQWGQPDDIAHPSELLELIPYMHVLESRQRGQAFLGLDSGFQHINHLCNGLDTGLFIIAAPPGEGKTTFVWQMVCQVAERERVPVIFCSFEQSKGELRAKVLSRLSRVEYRYILRGRLRADDTQNWPVVLEAATRYARTAQWVTIVEGDDRTTIDEIRRLALAKKAEAQAARVLLAVDYLQILPLHEKDAGRVSSAKDKVDLHVSALRRLARELDSPVIAISSENRAGYKSKGLDVFKESGIIEYSADIAAVMTRDASKTDSAAADYRVENLNIVKNRNGECGVVKFKFYGKRAEFVELERGPLPADPEN